MKEIDTTTFYAHGKLLLTGEYCVLEGATALAVPTRLGQSLEVFRAENTEGGLLWQSFDADKSLWFEGVFDTVTYALKNSNDDKVGILLSKILQTAFALNPNYPRLNGTIQTHLTFPRDWGLGTSSTLIYNISQLFGVNPYSLLKETFGGSGYDIACAGANSALLYSLKQGNPIAEKVVFNPIFKDNLYFIYLGKKQNSREGIARYREKSKTISSQYFENISALAHAFLKAETLSGFESLIKRHEEIISAIIELPRAKELYFSDFWGEIKSLGAWGGDFILATSNKVADDTQQYFKNKGFEVVLKYEEMISI